ncbi:manganese transporter [Christiangramia fulva]|uniref:Manganese transporter n=1 Tax=Christiangramia fulva TaxID=2126553 RepID=A0A2R3Z9N4_9FLAO|nr:Nramp family divalent metal transporter [Christiangramia fulva]AVR46976.1 manganese transporter [Christiangramia fulva]
MKDFLKNLGPGILVSAAFIGPGTVTVCSLAGVHFGYSLLWALLISVIACIILQEMSARLGLITGKSLSENIRQELKPPVIRNTVLILIFSAIVIGNAAYEAGNITGAVLGMEAITGSLNIVIGDFSLNFWSLIIGLFAFLLLWLGTYKKIEKAFIALVFLMSISFIVTAFLTRPKLSEVLEGFIPQQFNAGLFTIIALVGTTVVPYNLFLHASLVSEKWNGRKNLPILRKELVFSIILGGLVSMAILICAAAADVQGIENAADLAVGLEPLFGSLAKYFLALGLLAAGITSAITAPLAAAFVVKGCLGWKGGFASGRFKSVWIIVLMLGIIFSGIGLKPVQIINFAQISNGLVLPIVAFFLFWIVNRRSLMGEDKNTLFQNILGVAVIALAFFLGLKSVWNVIQNW